MSRALALIELGALDEGSVDALAGRLGLGERQLRRSIRPAEENALRARIRFPKLSALPVIIARLRRVFDLTADPLPISAHLAKDSALAPLVATRPGLRVPGAWDGFELAIRAVLGQQITVPAAVRLAGRLVATHGEPLAEPDRDLTHVFPRPKVLALADLTTLGMPRSRAATLSAVAAAVGADPDLFCASRGLDEAIQRLQSIRGWRMDGALYRLTSAA